MTPATHRDPEAGQNPDYEGTNYRHIVSKLLRHWYIFLVGIFLAAGVAAIYLSRTIPQYSITSLVLIKDRKSAPDPAKNTVFADVTTSTYSNNIDNDIAALKSTSLMERVLRELSINAIYHVHTKLYDQELYRTELPFTLVVDTLREAASGRTIKIALAANNQFTLDENGKSTHYQLGQVVTLPYATFRVVAAPGNVAAHTNEPVAVTFLDIQKTATEYAHNLAIIPVSKQASVLSLTLINSVPARGEAILNKLIEVYNKENIEDNNAMASNTILFINKRLTTLEGEITNVEKGVENFKHKYDVSDVGSQVSQSLAEKSTYNQQIAEYDVQIEVLRSIQRYATTGNGDQLIPSVLVTKDASLTALTTKFNELQLNISRMLRTANESNPLIKNMYDLRNDLRAEILQDIQSTMKSLLISRQSLKEKSGTFGSRLQQVPTVERGLLEIGRQQEIKRALYSYLLQKREEAGLSLAATISKSRIIDPALANPIPISPNRKSVMLLALLLGLGLPAAFVYAKELLADKVQLISDVTEVTAAPVLGEIAHSTTDNQVVISANDHSPVAEMLRLVRTHLQFAVESAEGKVLLITSGCSGEGKTFFSLNLAASLVLAGKKTVLVQMDLRKRHVAWGTGAVGVADYLLHEHISVDDIVTPAQAVPGLYVVDAGEMPQHPSELLMHARAGKLLGILKESFDYVLIDSAPVGQVADAFNLASYLDLTLFLVRYNYTRKTQLTLINSVLLNKRLPKLMLVLNDASKSNLHGHSYGYYGQPDAPRRNKRP